MDTDIAVLASRLSEESEMFAADPRFRIVALQLSKNDGHMTSHSMTLHHGCWDSEAEAVGVAMGKLPDLKPGFSVDQYLVASPFQPSNPPGIQESE